MQPGWLVLVSIGYAALLFAIAWIGDRYPLYPQRPWLRPAVYSLALAVYCSSWTFYGAVGSAVRFGVGYLPIYLGPIILLLFGWRIIERLALIAQSQNTVSIADFLAARYGRSQGVAATVAIIAILAAIPYLTLQYKAVAISLGVLGGPEMLSTTFGDPALYVAVLMALFSILFGTRQVDATEHRPGLMLAVAFESLVKLIALVMVGWFAIDWFSDNNLNVVHASRTLIETIPPVGFLAQMLLAFGALICLPRQFHVAIVECGDVLDIRRARWLFGCYLAIISLMVLPIASAGIAVFGANGSDVAPDIFVLAFPLSQNQNALAVMAYIGGFSAATGMVIVVSVALATMVSNDLIMPLMLRRRWAHGNSRSVASTVLWIRRVAIIMIAAMAYGYYRVSGTDTALAAFGLMAFAAVGQFAPALIGGLFWRGASRQGVQAGLLIGFAVWVYTLLLPTLTDAGWINKDWLDSGLFGLRWLRPRQLFGVEGWDPLTHGTFWSLLFNIIALLLVSTRWPPSLGERLRAEPFLDPYAARRSLASGHWQGGVLVSDLLALAERIIGEKAARRAFSDRAMQTGRPLSADLRADRQWIQFTELLLAAAVGAASARLVLTSVLKGSGMEVAAVVAVLDEAGQELRFNRDILLSTLENIDQGVSVVDADMRLVAWNNRYMEMFNYPEGMLFVGRSVADLIRYNAERGELGSPDELDIQKEIVKRISFMRKGTNHTYERTLSNGNVIELRGRPLPGGGYVTSFSDITEYKRVERELREINETLEQRVTERTQEAEMAQESRSRFLTAVSHDVLQPINAARLFSSAMRESCTNEERIHLAERIDSSLRAAEELLDGLLDISRLDAGALKPDITEFDVYPMMQQLYEQYAPMAKARNLQIRLYGKSAYLISDKRLLRRVLQNFIANALRYTRRGFILLAIRIKKDRVILQVRDTGPGIPEHHLKQIYDEFHRFEQPFDWDGRGLGLGLSICQRISRLLDHPLDAHSIVQKGSVFSVSAPLVKNPVVKPSRKSVSRPAAMTVKGLRVLCLDNDSDILAAMRSLLERWEVEVLCAVTVDEAISLLQHKPRIILADYHLHDRVDGLDALDELRAVDPTMWGALLTADGSYNLKQAAKARGYRVITKPVRPASLRAFLSAGYQADK